MEFLNSIMEFLKGDMMSTIVLVLFAVSEALAAIPAVKENAIYQVVVDVIKWVMGALGIGSSKK